ncbi:MAG TPA: aminopeptidase P family protein [Saprospiraceae bacterium]|nr:aminopeptidase P family protein [Saprospiraceae bacterium]
MKLFDASVYQQRRQALMQKMGNGILLFPGAGEQPFNYKANTYPFRQDSSFLYYFGIAQPGLAGVVDADKGASILFGHDADLEEVVWMGPQPTMKEQAQWIGAEHLPIDQLANKVKGRDAYFLPPYHADRILFLSKLLDRSVDDIQSGHSRELANAVIDQRIYKSAEEIAQMEDAMKITAEIHNKLRTTVEAGKYEAHLRAVSEGMAFAHQGRLAYGAICTVQGQTLHNNAYHRQLKEGQMLLCDIGAENEMGYASDITRTYPVSREFSSQQAEMYDLVLKAETESMKAVKPGVKYMDVHLGAARIIADGLKQIGLMKGDIDEAVAAGAHALFFPHGLGHMIGLDVHDMENLGENNVGYDGSVERSTQFGTAYLRLARPLEAGFALTVEPGIYFIPELIDQWESEGQFSDFINYDKVKAYNNFTGIRIEDNVVVTQDGNALIGPSIPKERKQVERS